MHAQQANRSVFWIILVLCLFIIWITGRNVPDDPKSDFNKFRVTFIGKEKELGDLIRKLKNNIVEGGEVTREAIEKTAFSAKNPDFIIRIFVNDSLRYWNEHSFPVNAIFDTSVYLQKVVRLKNGWYRISHDTFRITGKGGDSAICFIAGCFLIKHEYPWQNKYLSDRFAPWFNLDANCVIDPVKNKDNYPVHSIDGDFLFSVFLAKKNPFTRQNEGSILLLSILAVCAAVIFLVAVQREIQRGKKRTFWIAFFVLAVAVFRGIMIANRFPEFIYSSPLFAPHIYASSDLFPSMGDFFLNAAVVLYLMAFLYRNRDYFPAPGKGHVLQFFLILFLLSYGLFINYLFKGLILNSNLTFSVYNLFKMDFYSLVGLAAICTWIGSFFLLSETIFSYFNSRGLINVTGRSIFSGAALIYIVSSAITGNSSIVTIAWPLLFTASGFWLHTGNRLHYRTVTHFLLIVVFTIAGLFTLFHFSMQRDRNHRKLLAEKLVIEKDPIAEYVFSHTENAMVSDSVITGFLDDTVTDNNELLKYISDRYLSGYLGRFDINTTVCNEWDTLMIRPDNIMESCYDFFTRQISGYGKPTMNKDLYFMDRKDGRILYLAKIEFPSCRRILFLEMNSKWNYNLTGYPELLINDKLDILKGLAGYSYAKYFRNRLISGSETYSYTLEPAWSRSSGRGFTESDTGEFNHLVYSPEKDTVIIISKKNTTLFEYFIAFTYLLCFFTLIIFPILILTGVLKTDITGQVSTFRGKIQISVISVLLFSLLPVGILAYQYIMTLYRQTADENLMEKARSILVELEHKFSGQDALTGSNREFIAQTLVKFSNVFFTDVNLFGTGGELIASSREEIYNAGLAGRVMNPVAFNEMTQGSRTQFIHEEKIGDFVYLSSYRPFFNYRNELIAYLNVPYFSRQEKREEAISTFIATLLNVYILLILLSVASGIVIANRITFPLRLIREKISLLQIGKPNEAINWKSRDELGQLVEQYNKMIVQLEENALQLAKSERESAWRGMAKQVAHEIKNPLTPMRLQIQHLERMLAGNETVDPVYLKKISSTLLQQIDTLSSIAVAFSDFAKMPEPRKEPVNLTSIVSDASLLYRNTGNVQINFLFSEEERIVTADRDHLLRVFNNMLKNGIQAIPEAKAGEIEINIIDRKDSYIVTIKDNGTGIPMEQQSKIFTPDFTTKSGGMGLGLVMVKNIVELTGGRVWFESEEGRGTRFCVELRRNNYSG